MYKFPYIILTYTVTTFTIYFPNVVGITLYDDPCYYRVAIIPAMAISLPFCIFINDLTLGQTFFSGFISQLFLILCYYFQYFALTPGKTPVYLCDITGCISALVFGFLASLAGILVKNV